MSFVATATTLSWTAGLAIDADGSPRAYGPPGTKPLDYLANAGEPGNWWGIVTVAGVPVVQGEDDPAPGYYVSPTALFDRARKVTDPRRYVDSERVPYLAVPKTVLRAGVRLGDVAWVTYRGRGAAAIVADVGPSGKLGEGSIALARALGIPSSPKRGGVGSGVSATIWFGSRGKPPWPRTAESIAEQVARLRERT